MGGERWLMLKSVKEAERLKAFLAPLDGGLVAEEQQAGVWFDWHGKLRFEVGYQASVLCSEMADIVSREICKRFGVTKIGADSVGWYPDSDWKSDHPRGAKKRYGEYTDWVTWMREYQQAFSHYFGRYPEDYDDGEWKDLEAPVLEAFAKLDEASNA